MLVSFLFFSCCFFNMIKYDLCSWCINSFTDSWPLSVTKISVLQSGTFFFFKQHCSHRFCLVNPIVYKCFVYFPKYCHLHSLSVNLQCFCVCLNTYPLNICCFVLLCEFFLLLLLFYLWTQQLLNIQIEYIYTLNSELWHHIWFDHTLSFKSNNKMLKH